MSTCQGLGFLSFTGERAPFFGRHGIRRAVISLDRLDCGQEASVDKPLLAESCFEGESRRFRVRVH
jgi:hypothetical protein